MKLLIKLMYRIIMDIIRIYSFSLRLRYFFFYKKDDARYFIFLCTVTNLNIPVFYPRYQLTN